MYTHNLDPILFDFGFLVIRWYSLAYIFGILIGWYLGKRVILGRFKNLNFDIKEFDNLITFIIISLLLGGRIGYILFYNFGYYISNPFDIADKKSTIAFGTNISNIGAKMAYTENAERDFIPTNLRLGSTISTELDEFNQFSFSFDVNKLLVPTNPYYDPNDGSIVSGKDPNVGVASGIFGSFSDAPGNVLLDNNNNYYVQDIGMTYFNINQDDNDLLRDVEDGDWKVEFRWWITGEEENTRNERGSLYLPVFMCSSARAHS